MKKITDLDVLDEAKEWKIFASENHDGGSLMGKPVCSPYVDEIVDFCDLVISEVTYLRSRIKELELRDETLIPHGCTLITDKMVDRAWSLGKKFCEMNVSDVFKSLGIYECGMCGGSGGVTISTENGDFDGDCGACEGHGWIYE